MLKQQIHLLAEGSGGTGAHPAQLGRQDFGNVLSSILLEVSSPKKPRWNFCLQLCRASRVLWARHPTHTQSPGPGGPGGNSRILEGLRRVQGNTQTQGIAGTAPEPTLPPFPKVSRCCWTKSGCHTEQPLPPNNRVQAPRASPAPRWSQGLGSSGSSSWSRFQKSSG